MVAQANSVVFWEGGGGPPPACEPLLSDRFLEDDMAAFWLAVRYGEWCGVACWLRCACPCPHGTRRLGDLGDDGAR